MRLSANRQGNTFAGRSVNALSSLRITDPTYELLIDNRSSA